jgi:eukaryotic-like serine/threonine-protein kinase
MSDSPEDDAAQRLGRYTLFGEIAAGGMATVCFGRLAGEAGFAKTVAIKRLHPELARDEGFREMFVEEARLAARIRHPNVVPTLDVVAEGGELFLVMEYVHGESLSRLLRAMRARTEHVSPKIAAAVMSGVLHGLHAAHEATNEAGEPLNLAHRDVSPQNVIVGADGVARVIDFGIAKARSSAQTTREGELRGKLPYMAPEQLGTTPASRLTDIYAAAVVLWEMLSGRRLFEADDERVVFGRIIAGAEGLPSAFAPDIPPALDAAVMRGLAKDPDARFATARDMALAIEEATPLATHTQVGAWVERVARDALTSRGRRLARVESVMSTSNVAALDRASSPPHPAPPRSARPPPSARPPASAPPPPLATGLPPPDIDPLGPPRAGLSKLPALPADTRPKASRGSGAIVALGLLLVASVGGYVGVPALVERHLVAGAKERGMTLTVADVTLSAHAIHLRGVELTAPEVPGARVSAPTVELGLEGLSIVRIAADEADVALDGATLPTLDALDRFRRARFPSVEPPLGAIVAENLRLSWGRALGDATRIVVENARVEIARVEGRALGQDLSATLGLVKLETPFGTFGPYAGTALRDPRSWHGKLRLDATGAANLQATWSADGTGAVQLDASPLTLAELGLPPGFGRAQVLGTVRWAVPGPSKVDARVDLTVRGLSAFGAPTDLRVEADVTGDVRHALPLANAALTVDGVRAPATGTLDASSGLRIDAKALGPRRPCPGDAPAQIAAELALDLRHVEETRGRLLSPGRCGAKRGTP